MENNKEKFEKELLKKYGYKNVESISEKNCILL